MNPVKKTRVGVIYGGRSGEHEVSLASAAAVFQNLDPGKYEAVPIRIEKDGSRTTLQSIRGVAALMRDQGLHTAVFVSDPSHMLRVLRMASDEGIEAYGSPTRTSPLERDPIKRADAIVHELGALAVYFVSGESP